MEIIDNRYIINLDEHTNRLESMKTQLQKLDLDFIRILGIKGSDLDRETRDKEVSDISKLISTSSIIGCALSHKTTWKKMLENGDKHAMIMEDDCVFGENFTQKLNDLLEELQTEDPLWDLVYLGYFGMANPEKCHNIFDKLSGLPFKKIQHKTNKKLKYSFVPEKPLGLHCYLISDKCARILLNRIKKINFHIDAEILNKSDGLRVYASKEILAHQYTSSENSSQTTSFPICINKLLDKHRLDNGLTAGYYFSAPMGGLLGVNFNLYIIFYILTLVFLPRNSYLSIYRILVFLLIVELLLDITNYKTIIIWGLIATLIYKIKLQNQTTK